MTDFLSMWTVYDRPRDYPHGYIARRCEIRSAGRIVQTTEVRIGATLEEVRAQLPPGCTAGRGIAEDDPVIVEVWF